MRVYIVRLMFILVILTSCKNGEKEYYDNGNIHKEYFLKGGNITGVYKEYFQNGNLKLIHLFENGKKVDSSVYFFENLNKIEKVLYYQLGDTIREINYYKNGSVSSKGSSVNDNKIKKWYYYRDDGSINKVFEYLIVNGKQTSNFANDLSP